MEIPLWGDTAAEFRCEKGWKQEETISADMSKTHLKL